jgi:predicted Zn-dependent protease
MATRLLRSIAIGSLMLGATGCATVSTTQSGAVGVDRQQSMLVSTEQVNKAATEQYSKIIGEAKKKDQLDRDAAQVQRVRTIMNRLTAQASVFRTDTAKWPWEVHVISSEQLNAWCMPGGKMAVYTGLIEKLRLTDEEIAAVMGHEIAHALREHSRERISRQMATGLVVGVASAALGLGQAGGQLADMVAQVTFTLPNSRLHEQEADRIGVELAARAGYDPRGAVSVWQKMAKAAESTPPEILSTHPSPASRIKDLEVYAARVMPLYEAKRRGS